ncbi:hypothetical protein H6G54_07895 [Anabaena cylindrica FACHB-243]|uniref:Uncharacterized protein n=1 Tax=Anabaena cylindrica (strain ATCC 27899 / PCC 7122) TaxID=272123 RepID=K9ZJT7_ANACC|nr:MULTISPECIES: hypothetical protein [Anabaena]AFZ59471.1 hypothetical protein Anacy_4103 [Anabaena cylindrica PCC 7122]MBD2417626.1 hypothetical protein [Anabaena cylindrica FACHB-243]MBY5283256.1 hypothetical protein [Anabaena sp. CCAP 1446/1C]MBY5310626.1 hypothetical protein [Anabaena sp. CCAP 1446/1C]MCM2405387.1 hypothetical protein [Anabaena sp. CCAP 1446/1C]
MNNIDLDSVATEDTNTLASEDSSDTPQRLLPRLAWDSQTTYLRLIFRAKKALDRIETEAGISRF